MNWTLNQSLQHGYGAIRYYTLFKIVIIMNRTFMSIFFVQKKKGTFFVDTSACPPQTNSTFTTIITNYIDRYLMGTTALTCDMWPGNNFIFPEKGSTGGSTVCNLKWNWWRNVQIILKVQLEVQQVALASYIEIDMITNNKLHLITMI